MFKRVQIQQRVLILVKKYDTAGMGLSLRGR